MSQIVLASASPRRKELLEQIGLEFEIWPAKGEEKIIGDSPSEIVSHLSAQKAEEVAVSILAYHEKHPDLITPGEILVIGADTVVACQGQIMGKPKDEEEAFDMLTLLSGRTHQVFTGVTFVVIGEDGRCGEHRFYDKTDVVVYDISEEEKRRYIASGEPMDKAGAYGIQGKFAVFIKEIHGDYNNVVGLPAAKVYQEMKRLGLPGLALEKEK